MDTPATAKPPLAIDGLVRRYGAFTAVDGVALTVGPGEIVGFLGPNGAGKTTTLRVVAGLLRPDAGAVTIAGHPLAERPLDAKRALGFVPDRPFLYDRLTAYEFLAFVAALYDVPPEVASERADTLLQRLGLLADARDTIDRYSLGMRQKTAIVAALLHAPPLLMLDEPLVGLDPMGARTLKDLLREHAARGGGVLVSTHLLDVAERLCDRVVILDRGRVIAAGTLAELRGPDRGATLEEVFFERLKPERAS